MKPTNYHLEVLAEELNKRLNSSSYSLSINVYDPYPPRIRVNKDDKEICQVIIPNRIVKKLGDIIFYNQREETEELENLKLIFLEIFRLKIRHNSIYYHLQDYAAMAWDIIHTDNPIDNFNYNKWASEYFQSQNDKTDKS